MKERIAIDIGACEGKFIDMALRDHCTVHAFEPNPELAARLTKNYPKETIVQAAAWDSDGEAPLYWHNKRLVEGSSLIKEKTNVSKYHIMVPTVNIGKYLQQFENVIVIKIDAEGAEYRIIESILDHYDPHKISRWLVEDHEPKVPDPAWRAHKEKVLTRLKEENIRLEEWR